MIRKLITVFGSLGILLVFFGVIGLLGSMRPKIEPTAVELAPPAVFYTVAKAEAVTLDVRAQGEVRPRTDINLTAQVGGKIVDTSAAFVDGGAFDKGDLLIKIEDADYRVAVATAKARVAQAEESLRMEEAESALAARDYEDLGRSENASDLALPSRWRTAAVAISASSREMPFAILNDPVVARAISAGCGTRCPFTVTVLALSSGTQDKPKKAEAGTVVFEPRKNTLCATVRPVDRASMTIRPNSRHAIMTRPTNSATAQATSQIWKKAPDSPLRFATSSISRANKPPNVQKAKTAIMPTKETRPVCGVITTFVTP